MHNQVAVIPALFCVIFWMLPEAVGMAQPDAESVHVLFHATLEDDASSSGRYRALTYRDAQWYGSTFWTGPDWTRVGKDWHHPGQNTPSVRRFVVPRDGAITITGRVFKLHRQGDGIRASILHNDHEIWRAEIDGTDGQGVDPQLKLDVRKGDNLRFVVHKRGHITCDTTGWDPVITFDDGARYQASAAFAARKQGSGGWYYEMDAGEAAMEDTPVVYSVTPELALLRMPILPNRPITFSSREALPLFVMARGDKRGIVIAMNPADQWTFRVLTDRAGIDATLRTRQAVSRPVVWSQSFQGTWSKAFVMAERALCDEPHLGLLRQHVDGALEDGVNSLALWVMIQDDWRRQDSIDDSVASYTAAIADQVDQTTRLLEDQDSENNTSFASQLRRLVDSLPDKSKLSQENMAQARERWIRLRKLKRRIALSNPLLQFPSLLICKRVPPSYSHEVGQYYGWRQRPGGGLFVVEQPGRSLRCRNIVGAQLPEGSFLEPRLSYDAQRILFAYVRCTADVPDPASLPVNEQGDVDRYLHLYEVGVDGSGLRQLTDGPYDDLMGEYLPDGDIVFCSTRRRSYSRCFGPQFSKRWDSYTLHRMGPNGGNVRILSVNDVNEWFPAVAHSGNLLFARWDYIDRDAVTHQNLWAAHPDGTNPVAVWGNATAKPHCMFQAKPVPGSNKIAFIASAHHAMTGGPVCLLDARVGSNRQEAITRVTPGPFPEAESSHIPEYYQAPWPLSEKYFLVAYSHERLRFEGEHLHDPNPDNALGIYLVDPAGNRELIYRDPDISCTNPTPVQARPKPPILNATAVTPRGSTGEMLIVDIYEGLGNVPRGAIKQLRVVQVFPKTTPLANNPRIGLAGEENGRAILGTVPVEPDGSAYFTVPALKPILFQAIDEQGNAYQTMRSTTYVQPGERVSCVGCHEHRQMTPLAAFATPTAARRSPSRIAPGELGGRPFSYVEIVQPVLDRHCVRCHNPAKKEGGIDLSGTPHKGFTQSYWSLCRPAHTATELRANPELAAKDLIPRFYQRNQIQSTPPGGKYGARGSRFMKLLRDGHEGVRLTSSEMRRLAAWIDLNAIFYGVYEADAQARQLRGEPVAMPDIQ